MGDALAKAVKERRTKRGWSQRELARRVAARLENVTESACRATVRRIEGGHGAYRNSNAKVIVHELVALLRLPKSLTTDHEPERSPKRRAECKRCGYELRNVCSHCGRCPTCGHTKSCPTRRYFWGGWR